MRKQLIRVGMEQDASTDVSFSSVQDIAAYVVETQGFTKQHKSFPWRSSREKRKQSETLSSGKPLLFSLSFHRKAQPLLIENWTLLFCIDIFQSAQVHGRCGPVSCSRIPLLESQIRPAASRPRHRYHSFACWFLWLLRNAVAEAKLADVSQ